MARSTSTRTPLRWRDLGAVARQTNHVVAAAVFVFVASILLQSVLSTPLLRAAGWIHRHWGTTGAAILAPLVLDGPTVLLLLAIAFPFGRVTAARPWVAGPALVLLVHAFWLSFHFVLGQHVLLWGNLLPALGRSLLIVLTLLGVVALMRAGRRVALEADGQGIPGRGDGASKAKKGGKGKDPGDKEPDSPGRAAAEAPATPPASTAPPAEEEPPPCKATGTADVSGGER